jgi:hypothetical protein
MAASRSTPTPAGQAMKVGSGSIWPVDHLLLMDRLALYVRDCNILYLLGQYLRRTAERGGWFWDCERGISLGCPVSPLIGAFFLGQLDRQITATGLFYIRFMDDILVLAPTRWKLRRAVTVVNEILGAWRSIPTRPSSAGSSAASIFSDTTLPPTASPSRWAPWPTSSTVRPGFMSNSGKGRKAPPRSGPTSSDGGLGRAEDSPFLPQTA